MSQDQGELMNIIAVNQNLECTRKEQPRDGKPPALNQGWLTQQRLISPSPQLTPSEYKAGGSAGFFSLSSQLLFTAHLKA